MMARPPLSRTVVFTLCLIASAQANPHGCTSCTGDLLKVGPVGLVASSSNQAFSSVNSVPGEVHTSASFEGCNSDTGCGGVKLEDGRVVDQYGNPLAVKGLASTNSILDAPIPKDGPFWWMQENSPFRNALETYNKNSQVSGSIDLAGNPFLNNGVSNSASFAGGSHSASSGNAAIDISKNPFLTGQISGTPLTTGGSSSFQSSFQSSSSSGSSNKNGVDLSANPFLNGAFSSGVGGSQDGIACNGKLGGNCGSPDLQIYQTGSTPGSSSFSSSSHTQTTQSGSGNTGTIDLSNNPFLSGHTNQFGLSSGSQNTQGGFSQTTQSQVNKFAAGSGISEGAFSQGNFVQQQEQVAGAFPSQEESSEDVGSGKLTITCSARGYICVPKSQCVNGQIIGNVLLKANQNSVQYCQASFESCCKISQQAATPSGFVAQTSFGSQNGYQSTTSGFSTKGQSDSSVAAQTFSQYRPGAEPNQKPGVPYLPPVESSISPSVYPTSSLAPYPPAIPIVPSPTPTIYRPTTPRAPLPPYRPPAPARPTNAPQYLPPLNQLPEQSIDSPTYVPGPEKDIEGSLLLSPNIFPKQNQNVIPDVPSGCAAALKCTAKEFCSAEGIIVDSPVILTKDQEDFRVPLTDCKDLETGLVGKCCRDPNYTDPWPTGLIGKWVPEAFGDTGAYKPDSRGQPTVRPVGDTRGSPNNKRPISASRPNNPRPTGGDEFGSPQRPTTPRTGVINLDNFRTPSPNAVGVFPSPTPDSRYEPSQPTGVTSTQNNGFQVNRGQTTFTQSSFGQGSLEKGQGAFGQGSIVKGQGAFGQGSIERGQGSFGSSESGQGSFGQGSIVKGQGAFGQGSIERGQGSFGSSESGQGAFGQGSVEQGQGGFNVFTKTDQETKFQVNRGQTTYNQNGGVTVTKQGGEASGENGGFEVNKGQGAFGSGSFGGFESSSEEFRYILSEYQATSQCGTPNNQRPFGDREKLEVDFGAIPWQAMILLETNRSLLCGGVITRPDVVITSARCVDGLLAKNVLIKGGEYKLGVDEEPLPFQIVAVKKILRHPGYRTGVLINDVAILVLNEKLRLAANIYPICLPSAAEQFDSLYAGEAGCITTGWGKQILQVNVAGSYLHSINVSLVRPSECQAQLSRTYSHLLDQYDASSCACAQPSNPVDNICKVDIGSALACNNGNGHYVLRGVYSWETTCKPGNQLASFYKFDLEWYEWALGLTKGSSSFSGFQQSSGNFQTAGNGNFLGNAQQAANGNFVGGSQISGNRQTQYTQKTQFGSTQGQLNGANQGQIAQIPSDGSLILQGQIGANQGNGFSKGGFSTGQYSFSSQTKFPTVQYQYETKSPVVTYQYETKTPIKGGSYKTSYQTQQKQVFQSPPVAIAYETSGSGQNPQYVAPGVTISPDFQGLVNGHIHTGPTCDCLNGK